MEPNQRLWDERVPIHVASDFYDVEGFLAGRCTLGALEREEVGPVEGRSLLHLQCHFGLDTLSWARRGARVTGLDFSSVGVQAARELAARGVNLAAARFVQSEVTLAHEVVEPHDIVFTSWGVLGWLPDIDAWARAAFACCRPGGLFYIAEIHPVAWLFEATPCPYFGRGRRFTEQTESTYADRSASLANTTEHFWCHTLGEILSALLSAGFVLEYVREHPFCCNDILPGMVKNDDGTWRQPDGGVDIPLAFSVRAHRPNEAQTPPSPRRPPRTLQG